MKRKRDKPMNNEEGVTVMCKAMEDMRNDVRIHNALEMIKDGQLSDEKIAQYSGLTLEKIKELKEKRSA